MPSGTMSTDFLPLDNEAALAEDAVDERGIVQAVHFGEECGEFSEAAFEEGALHGDGERVLFFRSPERDVEAAVGAECLADAGERAGRLVEELERLLAEGGVKGAGGKRGIFDGGLDIFDGRCAGRCGLAAGDGEHGVAYVERGDMARASDGFSGDARDDSGAGGDIEHVCAVRQVRVRDQLARGGCKHKRHQDFLVAAGALIGGEHFRGLRKDVRGVSSLEQLSCWCHRVSALCTVEFTCLGGLAAELKLLQPSA